MTDASGTKREGAVRQAGSRGRANAVVVGSCALFVATMVGAAFAAVPLYDLFCRVTGFAGTPTLAQSAPVEAVDRTISVRFDANVAGGLPWRFRPLERVVTVRLGEIHEIAYEIESLDDTTTWGTAAFNVAPSTTGAYFSKINCFCFSAQPLQANERRLVNVVFYIDPAIAEDDSTDGIPEVTLSYTFFPTEPPEDAAAVLHSIELGQSALAVGGRISDTDAQAAPDRRRGG